MKAPLLYMLLAFLCLPSNGQELAHAPRERERVAFSKYEMPRFSFPDLKIPGDVQGWIAAKESRVPDIRPGNEKGFQWAKGDRGQTDVALVYLHGWSASRGEIQPVMESVGEDLRANVFFTRLKGHGRTTEAMTEAEVEDWLLDAWEALLVGRRIGKKVVLVGTSTGASLALWLAHHKPELVEGVVLISPNFGPKDRWARLVLSPLGRKIAWLVEGNYREWEPQNAFEARYYTYKQPLSSLIPMLRLADHSRALPLEKIQVPVLALYTEHDTTADPVLIKKHVSRIPGVRLVHLGEAKEHVLSGHMGATHTTPKVIGLLKEFVNSLDTPEK